LNESVVFLKEIKNMTDLCINDEKLKTLLARTTTNTQKEQGDSRNWYSLNPNIMGIIEKLNGYFNRYLLQRLRDIIINKNYYPLRPWDERARYLQKHRGVARIRRVGGGCVERYESSANAYPKCIVRQIRNSAQGFEGSLRRSEADLHGSNGGGGNGEIGAFLGKVGQKICLYIKELA
jgi:hypothetical protein